MVTTPDQRSSDYTAMVDYWLKVRDLTNGVDAMRAAGAQYLPRFTSEGDADYKLRVDFAVFTNIYSDIVENLADRPFANEVTLVDASAKVREYAENIDGQGNNLHNFAASWFRNAIDYALDWVYVDFTRTNPDVIGADGKPRRKTIAEERQEGARPYWVRVPAIDMIAVYSAMINGVEEFVHCRMAEDFIERAGWDEVVVHQIREISREPIALENGEIIGFDDAYFRVWREQEVKVKGRKTEMKWVIVDEGPISIGVIPIVPLVVGQRKGQTWQVIPAMQSVANLQFEYYEQENGLKNIKGLTAYPMLTASGVSPEKDAQDNIIKAPVGPRAVLYGPATEFGNGVWSFIEPAGTSLTFLRGELKEAAKEMRELGRQPLTQSSGQLTTSTSDMAATKGMAAIQRWALLMKDALENAMFLTALWIRDSVEPTVFVDTNFDLSEEGDQGFDHVQAMREKGDLSRKTLWAEAQRRGILDEEFDPEEEDKNLDDEVPSDDPGDAGLLDDDVVSPNDDPQA